MIKNVVIENDKIIIKPYLGIYYTGILITGFLLLLVIITSVFFLITGNADLIIDRIIFSLPYIVGSLCIFCIGGLRTIVIDIKTKKVYSTLFFLKKFEINFFDIHSIKEIDNTQIYGIYRKNNPYDKPIRITNSNIYNLFTSDILPVLKLQIKQEEEYTNVLPINNILSRTDASKYYIKEGEFYIPKHLYKQSKIIPYLMIVGSIIVLLIGIVFVDTKFSFIYILVSFLLFMFALDHLFKKKLYFDTNKKIFVTESFRGNKKRYPYNNLIQLKVLNRTLFFFPAGREVQLIFNMPKHKITITLYDGIRKKDVSLFIKETEIILNNTVVQLHIIIN